MAFYPAKGGGEKINGDWWGIYSQYTGGSTLTIRITNNNTIVKTIATTEATSAVTVGPFVVTYASSKWNVSANDAYKIVACSESLPASWSPSTFRFISCLCEEK